MDNQFWCERWQQGEIGFHMGQPHHDLLSFFDRLGLANGEKVLVPLCGKSHDLLWLRDRGVEVLGVEVSELAVQAFCEENGLEVSQQRVADFISYRSSGLELLCGDVFQLSCEQLAEVGALFDRGALVALPADLRKRYAGLLCRLLPAACRMLLVSYAYDQSEMAGPPFAVSLQEIESLFGGRFSVEVLTEREALSTHDVLRQRGLSRLTEYCCLLERKTV
jgi:thiopurine S-methyltransferase